MNALKIQVLATNGYGISRRVTEMQENMNSPEKHEQKNKLLLFRWEYLKSIQKRDAFIAVSDCRDAKVPRLTVLLWHLPIGLQFLHNLIHHIASSGFSASARKFCQPLPSSRHYCFRLGVHTVGGKYLWLDFHQPRYTMLSTNKKSASHWMWKTDM